jgi:hypothetical protein
MPVLEPMDYSQPNNLLSQYADIERKKLIPKNDYKQTFEYSATNPDALSDGDIKGKGTGVFLDSINGGNNLDIIERRAEIVINKYKEENPYTKPT